MSVASGCSVGCAGSSGVGVLGLSALCGWVVGAPCVGGAARTPEPPSPPPGPLQEPQDLPGGAGQDEAPSHPLHSAHPQRCSGGHGGGVPLLHVGPPSLPQSPPPTPRSDLPARRQQNPPGRVGQRGEAGGCCAWGGTVGIGGPWGVHNNIPRVDGGGCGVLGGLTGLLCVPALHRREGEDHPQVPEPPAV